MTFVGKDKLGTGATCQGQTNAFARQTRRNNVWMFRRTDEAWLRVADRFVGQYGYGCTFCKPRA